MARSSRGSATVEHAALALLVALIACAGIAALSSSPARSGTRELASAIARKLRCAPRLPGPCWRDPLTEAYGRSLAGAVRALAPAPMTIGGIVPVDFRYCRHASCAVPGRRYGLTASNRRVTAFTAVDDRRRSGGSAAITYWTYRPGAGWGRIVRQAGPAAIAALARTRLLDRDVPVLVPLETLDGRNQYDFAAAEAPPWRWRVESVERG